MNFTKRIKVSGVVSSAAVVGLLLATNLTMSTHAFANTLHPQNIIHTNVTKLTVPYTPIVKNNLVLLQNTENQAGATIASAETLLQSSNTKVRDDATRNTLNTTIQNLKQLQNTQKEHNIVWTDSHNNNTQNTVNNYTTAINYVNQAMQVVTSSINDKVQADAQAAAAAAAAAKAAAQAAQEAKAAQEKQAQVTAQFVAHYNSGIKDTNAYTPISSTNAIVQYAMQWLGHPYVWGGSTPNGWDCSGFVMFVFAHYGINLPHSSGAMSHMGTKINNLAQAQPGDIIANDVHVGIYIGNGLIINAANPHDGTMISPISYFPGTYNIERIM